MTKIKICGITNLKDARLCEEMGVDFIGFIFAPSLRQVDVRHSRKIIKRLSPNIKKVGVFVNEELYKVNQTVKMAGLDYVQLHGEESKAFCEKVSVPVIKAFRIAAQRSLKRAEAYEEYAKYFLFDAFVKGKRGGTGKTFRWSMLKKLKSPNPYFVSGGLNVENVAQAIKALKPFAVDASSSLEESPGIKDPILISQFICAVRSS